MHVDEIRVAIAEVEHLRSRLAELEENLALIRGRNAELNRRLDDLHLSHDRLDRLEKIVVEETVLSSRLKFALDWVVSSCPAAPALPGWVDNVGPAFAMWGELRDGAF